MTRILHPAPIPFLDALTRALSQDTSASAEDLRQKVQQARTRPLMMSAAIELFNGVLDRAAALTTEPRAALPVAFPDLAYGTCESFDYRDFIRTAAVPCHLLQFHSGQRTFDGMTVSGMVALQHDTSHANNKWHLIAGDDPGHRADELRHAPVEEQRRARMQADPVEVLRANTSRMKSVATRTDFLARVMDRVDVTGDLNMVWALFDFTHEVIHARSIAPGSIIEHLEARRRELDGLPDAWRLEFTLDSSGAMVPKPDGHQAPRFYQQLFHPSWYGDCLFRGAAPSVGALRQSFDKLQAILAQTPLRSWEEVSGGASSSSLPQMRCARM